MKNALCFEVTIYSEDKIKALGGDEVIQVEYICLYIQNVECIYLLRTAFNRAFKVEKGDVASKEEQEWTVRQKV